MPDGIAEVSTLTAVCFVGEKTGGAVGHWGVVLRTDDAGESWNVQRADTSVDLPLFSVHFKDAERGWAVGLWSLMIATSDGGKSWTTVRLPAPPSSPTANTFGGATFKSSQRDDRLPFSALAVAGNGRLVKFSRQGLVEDAPAAAPR